MSGFPAFMPVDGNGVLANVALGVERVVFAPRLVVGGNAGVDGAPDKGTEARAVGLVHGVGDHGGGFVIGTGDRNSEKDLSLKTN
ncbi:MAG: hypothetical protein QM680_14460 [Luteolibacter sp.]